MEGTHDNHQPSDANKKLEKPAIHPKIKSGKWKGPWQTWTK